MCVGAVNRRSRSGHYLPGIHSIVEWKNYFENAEGDGFWYIFGLEMVCNSVLVYRC